MHDDLGSGLTSIQLLIGQIQENAQSLKNPKVFLNKINARTSELIENMREMMWAMNASSDNLPELIAYLRSYVVNYLDEQNITCIAKTPNDIPNRPVNGWVRRNIFLCAKEAAHNIVKHADASEVRFIIFVNSSIKMHLMDNGIGFDPDATNLNGYGLKNMKKRMLQMGGTLSIKSTNKGTQLMFKIPLDAEK